MENLQNSATNNKMKGKSIHAKRHCDPWQGRSNRNNFQRGCIKDKKKERCKYRNQTKDRGQQPIILDPFPN